MGFPWSDMSSVRLEKHNDTVRVRYVPKQQNYFEVHGPKKSGFDDGSMYMMKGDRARQLFNLSAAHLPSSDQTAAAK